MRIWELETACKKRRFLFLSSAAKAAYSIVNEHLRTTLGAKRCLFAKVSNRLGQNTAGLFFMRRARRLCLSDGVGVEGVAEAAADEEQEGEDASGYEEDADADPRSAEVVFGLGD